MVLYLTKQSKRQDGMLNPTKPIWYNISCFTFQQLFHQINVVTCSIQRIFPQLLEIIQLYTFVHWNFKQTDENYPTLYFVHQIFPTNRHNFSNKQTRIFQDKKGCPLRFEPMKLTECSNTCICSNHTSAASPIYSIPVPI